MPYCFIVTACRSLEMECRQMKMVKQFQEQGIWFLTGSHGNVMEKRFPKFIRRKSL